MLHQMQTFAANCHCSMQLHRLLQTSASEVALDNRKPFAGTASNTQILIDFRINKTDFIFRHSDRILGTNIHARPAAAAIFLSSNKTIELMIYLL